MLKTTRLAAWKRFCLVRTCSTFITPWTVWGQRKRMGAQSGPAPRCAEAPTPPKPQGTHLHCAGLVPRPDKLRCTQVLPADEVVERITCPPGRGGGQHRRLLHYHLQSRGYKLQEGCWDKVYGSLLSEMLNLRPWRKMYLHHTVGKETQEALQRSPVPGGESRSLRGNAQGCYMAHLHTGVWSGGRTESSSAVRQRKRMKRERMQPPEVPED